MKYLQGVAEFSNMPYVNVSMDIGAAINALRNATTLANLVTQ